MRRTLKKVVLEREGRGGEEHGSGGWGRLVVG